MKNTKLNLSVVILSIIEAICFFMPFCLTKEYWKYDNSFIYHGQSTLTSRTGINIFQVQTPLGKCLAIILLCVTLFAAVVYLLKALEIMPSISQKAWIVSIIHTVLMIIFLSYVCNDASYESITYWLSYSLDWMSFVVIGLNVISLVLSLLLKYGKMPVAAQSNSNSIKNSADSLDSLVAYKELLDSGILTQEEFDEKKKQILGM